MSRPVDRPNLLRDPARRPWLVWGIGVSVYFLAIFHRSSLGVAGVLAVQRFGIGSVALATFTVLQLFVYASMQVPVGLAVDRWGPRRLLTTGLIVMAVGQTAFALTQTYPVALLARAVVGGGDAMVFVSMLRLIAIWFPPRRNPLVVQLTAFVGQAGNVVAALPLAYALHHIGWAPTFGGAAMLTLALTTVVLGLMPDVPGTAPPLRRAVLERSMVPLRWAVGELEGSVQREPLGQQLRAVAGVPAVRLGLWVHFTTGFSGGVFVLLWGYPYLVQGLGLSVGTAGLLLEVFIAVSMIAGPLVGQLIGRHPGARVPLVLTVVAAITSVWVLVLAWPGGRPPLPALVLLVAVLGTGGPTSLVSFDIARGAVSGQRVGTATGLVNIGGFVASIVTLLAIGGVLQLLSPGGALTSAPVGAFRWAFAVQLPVLGLGVARILSHARRAGYLGAGRGGGAGRGRVGGRGRGGGRGTSEELASARG